MKTEYNINGQRRKGYILLKYCFLKILKFTDVSSDPFKEFHSLKIHVYHVEETVRSICFDYFKENKPMIKLTQEEGKTF